MIRGVLVLQLVLDAFETDFVVVDSALDFLKCLAVGRTYAVESPNPQYDNQQHNPFLLDQF